MRCFEIDALAREQFAFAALARRAVRSEVAVGIDDAMTRNEQPQRIARHDRGCSADRKRPPCGAGKPAVRSRLAVGDLPRCSEHLTLEISRPAQVKWEIVGT